jgi:hypothetical protein
MDYQLNCKFCKFLHLQRATFTLCYRTQSGQCSHIKQRLDERGSILSGAQERAPTFSHPNNG